MRAIQTLLKTISITVVSTLVAASAGASPVKDFDLLRTYDRSSGPEVPFPLKAELPFPWGTIEGLWLAQGNGINAYFSFEVQVDNNNRKVLRVIHIDSNKRFVVAEGTGIGVEKRRIVRAAMSGELGNYMLYIGAFKNPKTGGTMNVLTVRSFGDGEVNDGQVVVRKISNDPVLPFRIRK